MTKKPLVSIILFTHNVQQYIKNNLQSMQKINYKNVEIILTDRFSTDKTISIAKKFKKVKILQAPKERSTQVNFAAKKAAGRFLFITGADIEYHPKYLSLAVAACENNGFDAIYTSVVTKNDSFFGKCKALERFCYINDDEHETARFVKKKIFDAVNGYDENLVAGEDYDFQRKLNQKKYRTGRVPVVAEYHLGEEASLLQIIKRSFYYGITFYRYWQKYKFSSIKQMSPIRASYFKNWRLWLSDPVHTIGFIVYKIVQYTFGALGLIYGFILATFQFQHTHHCKKTKKKDD